MSVESRSAWRERPERSEREERAKHLSSRLTLEPTPDEMQQASDLILDLLQEREQMLLGLDATRERAQAAEQCNLQLLRTLDAWKRRALRIERRMSEATW